MQRRNRGFLLLFLAMSALTLFSTKIILPAHAAGTAYVSPGALPTASTGSTVTFQVQVANVDPFTAWDIEIRTDADVIKPQSISIEGNLLAANFGANMYIGADCVNGLGKGCQPEDGLGVVHSAAAALGSTSLPPSAVSGLLFNITYLVINGGSGVSPIDFLRGIIANGVTGALIAVDSVNGLYGSAPDFGVRLSPVFGTVTQGDKLAFSATIRSFNGFQGEVNITADSLLPVFAQPTNVSLSSGGSATVTLLASTTLCDAPGSYGLSITGTSGSLSHTFLSSPTLAPSPSTSPDFCIQLLSRPLVTAEQGAISYSSILLRSANGFKGTVSLNAYVLPSLTNGPIGTLQSATVSLFSGGRVAEALTLFTSETTPVGQYTIVVNATFGSLSHFVIISLHVSPARPSFSISASSTVLTVAPDSNTTDTITLTSLHGFNAPVALGTNISPFTTEGPTISLSDYTFVLSKSVNSTLMVSAPRDSNTGQYNVTVFATGGGFSNSIRVTIDVVPLIPPTFVQFHWMHRVSVSRSIGNETFLMGISNPNKDTTIFLEIQIVGVSDSGKIFTLATGLIELTPGHGIVILSLVETLTPSDVGTTFSFSADMLWGTSPTNLSISGSSKPGVPASGSFVVIA